jgi:hypothetical protein
VVNAQLDRNKIAASIPELVPICGPTHSAPEKYLDLAAKYTCHTAISERVFALVVVLVLFAVIPEGNLLFPAT